MKNAMKMALLAAALMIAGEGYAQTKKDTTLGQKIDKTADKVGTATSKAAKSVGKKTSELAAKGAAAVVDKKYAGKQGPNGEIIYINEKSQYYYVNKSGKRVFLTKAELRDKPVN